MALLLLVLCLSVCGISGSKCYNTDPTRGKCLGYEEFSPEVMDTLFPSINFTQCIERCTEKPACVRIQWSYKDKLCYPLEIGLATQLEKNGNECLHFKKQSCEKKEVTEMTTFSDFHFKGGLLVKMVDSDDNCRSICFSWEACSAYSWSSVKFTTSTVYNCYLHQKVPPNSGEKVRHGEQQRVKKGRYILETWRSHMYTFWKDFSKYEKAQKKFQRILECADVCARLLTCGGFGWVLNTNEKNCIINYESLPMYVKKTLT